MKDKDVFERLQEARIQSGYRELNGKAIFIKKILRKILYILYGWFIEPILQQQSEFNCLTSDLMKEAFDRIHKLEALNRSLNEELDNQNKALEKQLEIILEQKHTVTKLEIQLRLQKREEKEDIKEDKGNKELSVVEQFQNSSLDYFDFENKFRGSREIIKDSQKGYLIYFNHIDSDGFVLDIGCGRGEFLELLKENKILSKGIDCHQPFVDYCKSKNLDVAVSDAIEYLYSLPDQSLNGIFLGQVIEHLSSEYAITLIQLAYQKLKPDTYFVLETPNPQNLMTYQNFYLDASHIKPVHYLTVEYWFYHANFKEVQRINNEFSKYPFSFPQIQGENIENIEEINKAIMFINENMFGYCDYTLVAKR